MGIDRETAKRSASKEFGERFWVWYAAPYIAGMVIKAVCGIALAIGVLLAGRFIYHHAGEWVAGAGQLSTHYLLPMILVAIGVILYAAGAVIAWVRWGWLWKTKGLTSSIYTLGMGVVLMSFMFLIGVVV